MPFLNYFIHSYTFKINNSSFALLSQVRDTHNCIKLICMETNSYHCPVHDLLRVKNHLLDSCVGLGGKQACTYEEE